MRGSKTSSTSREYGDRATRSTLFVGSTEKTFKVLHAFDGPNRYMSLVDIAKAAGLDRSATQRLVYTLEALGYLARVPDTRTYGLTSKVLHLSYNYLRAHELVAKASPYLLDISRGVGETTNLHELDGHQIVFVARCPGKHIANIEFEVGSRLPALFTASGHAILSRLPTQRVREVLEMTPLDPLTPFTQTNPRKLLESVKTVAARGYAVMESQAVLGDISIAAPIMDYNGVPVAAVSISVATSRWSLERAEAELAPHVQVVATSISKARLAAIAR